MKLEFNWSAQALPRFPTPLAPVHSNRKFSAVLGPTSLKSSHTLAAMVADDNHAAEAAN